ncbi:MAG TPA: tetratricopeptide repeat protein, partial [Chthonomonadaceae bacterium]|nr:tetratricopeptide repeat protein [Chthonomonadaceae bacterium]
SFRVPSLSLPPDVKRPGTAGDPAGGQMAEKDRIATLLEYEAARLFVARACQALPAWKPRAHHAQAIGQICRQLDGIPLAIELAAARVKALSVEQIQTRLNDRFRLLSGGNRTAMPRQQTLKALFDWSYELLTQAEKALLARLSVFSGGWTLEAVETVCAGEGIEDRGLLDLLTGLVEKSLVLSEEQGGKSRYRMLETIREYAWQRLHEGRKEAEWRNRHLMFFLELVEQAEPHLNGALQEEWLECLEKEHDNLRAALSWSRQGRENTEMGLRLAGALWRFWDIRGYWREGREHLQTILSQEVILQKPSARAKALNAAGPLAFNQGDYAAARAFYEESLAIYRMSGDDRGAASSLGNLGNVAYIQGDHAIARASYEESLALYRKSADDRGIASSLNGLGHVTKDQGDYAAARACYKESLALYRKSGDRQGIAYLLLNLGLVAYFQGDYAAAQAHYHEGLAKFRELGDRPGTATSLHNLGLIAFDRGDYAAARALSEESLAIYRMLGDRRGIASSLGSLGLVAYNVGDYAAARTPFQESLATFTELGDRWGMASSLGNLGLVAEKQSDTAKARVLLGESLEIRRDIGDNQGIACSLENLAELATGQGQAERAARLCAAAEALREAIACPLPPKDREEMDRIVAATQTALGEPAFSAAWSEGRSLTFEQAIDYALG